MYYTIGERILKGTILQNCELKAGTDAGKPQVLRVCEANSRSELHTEVQFRYRRRASPYAIHTFRPVCVLWLEENCIVACGVQFVLTNERNYGARADKASTSGCLGGICVTFCCASVNAARLTHRHPGRCGVSPPEGAARNKVRARGRLSPFVKLILLKLDVRTFI